MHMYLVEKIKGVLAKHNGYLTLIGRVGSGYRLMYTDRSRVIMFIFKNRMGLEIRFIEPGYSIVSLPNESTYDAITRVDHICHYIENEQYGILDIGDIESILDELVEEKKKYLRGVLDNFTLGEKTFSVRGNDSYIVVENCDMGTTHDIKVYKFPESLNPSSVRCYVFEKNTHEIACHIHNLMIGDE